MVSEAFYNLCDSVSSAAMLRDLSTIQKSTPLSGKKSPDFWNAQGNRLGCLNPHEPTGRWHSRQVGHVLGRQSWESAAGGAQLMVHWVVIGTKAFL